MLTEQQRIEWPSDLIDGCAYVEAWRRVRERQAWERDAARLRESRQRYRPGIHPRVLVWVGVMAVIVTALVMVLS